MDPRISRWLISAAPLLCLLAICFGQQPAKRNDRPQPPVSTTPVQAREETKTSANATRYSYEFSQPQFMISRIVIEHDALGRGKIAFERKGEPTPIVEPIELSTSARGRIFGLWSELRFLDSDENYQASKNFAHLGTYRLSVDDGKRKRTAEFNWSNNTSAWSLTGEYRRVADQAILIFEITVARENQPLNAPSLLNQLESLYNRNGLSDAQQLVPLLKDLTTDEHIPLIARNKADRLLKKIEK